ncbi:MAG: hypothetical protein ABIP33_06455 [Pseudolysinimonas sp.]
MSTIGHLLNEPLTISTLGGSVKDGYGDELLAAQGAPANAVGYLEQVTTIEHVDDRDTTVSKWVVYLPAGTAIGRLDVITFQGQSFQVDGAPALKWNPRTQQVDHIECDLVVIAG